VAGSVADRLRQYPGAAALAQEMNIIKSFEVPIRLSIAALFLPASDFRL
jgi:hypothetical protein